MKNGNRKCVVGFGEVVWDIFPSGPCFGGAPANFACHAAELGADSFLIGAVGEDELGAKALAELKKYGVDVTHVARLGHPTGNVQIELDEGEPQYEISSDVAWDFCEWTAGLELMAPGVDAVCFGTLFQRSSVNRETLNRFLALTREDCLRVFDVNLRQQFWTNDIIVDSLNAANVLKLNQDELPIVAAAVGISGSVDVAVDELLRAFGLRMVVLTRGSEGSLLATKTERDTIAAESVELVDAVGAGDAFTACVTMGMLHNLDLPVINRLASKLAARVCEHSGAVSSTGQQFRDDFSS